MIDPAYVVTMAAYNAWQNDSLYAAADTLSEADRRAPRGAFFSSIHATLSHVLWGDRIWMSRFAGTPKPTQPTIAASVGEGGGWLALAAARREMDAAIKDWAAKLTRDALAGDLTWHSSILDRDMSRPLALLVTHFFNHQTHHRGQVHAMLTAAGAKPGDTDLFLMSDEAT